MSRPAVRRGLALLLALAALPPPGLAQSPVAGEATRGQALYEARCGGCHSPDANRIGPAHRGVVGRRAGSLPDFDYSAALKSATLTWSATTLERWLLDPEALVPGQKMGYSVPDAQARADLIAYLATLR